MKTCKYCGEQRPSADFTSGHLRCRLCLKAYHRARYERLKAQNDKTAPPHRRRCTKCEAELPADSFSRNPTGKDGFNSWCKECVRLYHHNRAAVDPSYKKNRNVAQKQRYRKNPAASLLASARYRAEKQSLPFDLTEDDIVIPAVCPVLGMRLRVNEGRRGAGPDSMTLDRVVPALGYVKGNVRVISARANILKRDVTDPAELRAVADYIEASKPI